MYTNGVCTIYIGPTQGRENRQNNDFKSNLRASLPRGPVGCMGNGLHKAYQRWSLRIWHWGGGEAHHQQPPTLRRPLLHARFPGPQPNLSVRW